MCETDMDMSELRSNTSQSGGTVYFEVSVGLQLGKEEASLNLTLFGYSNLSTLHLQPPVEEEKEEEEQGDNNDGQLKAFYCCLPVPPESRSSNQSHCLLSLSSRTVQNVTAKEEVPWKRTLRGEWQSVLRVLWLALLCVVLLAVITTVTGQIYWKRRSDKKQKRQPVGCSFTAQQLNETETQTDDAIPKAGTVIHPYGPRSWSGLSPIQEVDNHDDVETLLDGNVDNCYSVNLHHRGHPSSSSLTEEQPW
ncbi:uncharacterized protein LOC109989961 [Xyrichtys novacula]|uniref:Uncharacterized protein LOC109989961 n=1 Tax=Xyrichtys novacula TaxID=13765 RepID=A0AAV1EUC4_XYRNO|nr:uncharacterized protein LOC109989961 [Xyrichtys novacula]